MKVFKYFGFCLVVLISLYFFSSFVLENIFIGERKLKSDNKYIVYVLSGEIHTEFIFPISNDLFDWTKVIPVELVTRQIPSPKYVSIGWGSRDFYLNVKTWNKLKWPVLFEVVFLPSESALHVEYLKDIDKSMLVFPLYLTRKEYIDLIFYVKGFFMLDHQGKVQKISDFSYYGSDKFFKSHPRYHMFNNCNMWTQKGLAKINARRPVWSPTKYGIENAME